MNISTPLIETFYINMGKYNLTYYISNYSDIKILIQSTSFKIYSSEIKKYCTDENRICLIRFFVQSSYKRNSIIELNVTNIENNITKSFPKSNLEPKSNFLKDNLKIIIIISGSIIIFIIIIIIVCICICICIKKKNNKDLLDQVNKVSFEEERIKRNKAYEDGLLY